MTIINVTSQIKITQSVSTLKISKTLDANTNDHHLFYQAHKTIPLINIKINYTHLTHIAKTDTHNTQLCTNFSFNFSMLLLLQLSTCNRKRKSKFAHNCAFHFPNTYTLYLNEIEQNVDSEIYR